jgi:hypothetical protein
MLEIWNNLSLAVGDFLLGWLLLLPRDLTLVVVAAFTSLVLIGVRYLTTPQDRLRRAAEDGRQLKHLMHKARRESDRRALRRYRGTRSLIGLVKLKAEGWPLLGSLLPIALLATWAVHRLEYFPVHVGELVELAVYTPVTAVGEVAHVVPQEGLKAAEGWVRPIEKIAEDDEPPHGLATWHLKADRPSVWELTIRLKEQSLERQLIVGKRIYALPLVDHGHDIISEWKRPAYLWLGIVPGIEVLGLPAWLIGYVVLVVPITMLLKKVLGVY